MPHASRLRPGQPAASPLRIVVLGSDQVAAEIDRVERLLLDLGHQPTRLKAGESAAGGCPAGTDLVVVLGGDGSILRAARWMGYGQIPVLGINLGRLGFLADIARQQAAEAFADVGAGRFRLVDHLMFECEVVRAGRSIRRELGLNEASLHAGPPFSMIEIDLVVDGEPATTYRADGLIVSTPVGSTAYNLSAGGPIVRKDIDAFVFTPLNPHTLTNRTVVDSADRRYELLVARPNAGSACVVDGRVVAALEPGDVIRIARAEPRFELVETSQHGYYRTLRDKLAWGGGLRAAMPAPTRGPS